MDINYVHPEPNMAKKKKRKVSAYNRFVGARMKEGYTMKQASKLWKDKKKGSNPKRRRTKTARAKKAIRRGGRKLLGNLGAVGALEDLAIGYFGASIFKGMGYPTESALPMTRIAQGAIGMALNRRGKGRLAYGIIDLIDVYLLKRGIGIPQLSLNAFR